jgi:hypothetical protein
MIYLEDIHWLDNQRVFEKHYLEQKFSHNFWEGKLFKNLIELMHVMTHLVKSLIFRHQKLSCDRVQSILLKEGLYLPCAIKEIILATLSIIIFSWENCNLLILNIDIFHYFSHSLFHCLDYLWRINFRQYEIAFLLVFLNCLLIDKLFYLNNSRMNLVCLLLFQEIWTARIPRSSRRSK